jgi:exodeoxyribonuclease VII large subunit
MAITLKELNNILKEKIPKTMFHVKGEVSRPKLYPSALYFTLKDDIITISCKMWRNKLTEEMINIANGDNIEIKAQFDLYKGDLSLTVSWAKKLDNIGDLHGTFELMKNEFKEKGYFDKKFKLPPVIKKIAIITSMNGAAIHDFEYAINNSNSLLEIVKLDAQVQGSECPKQIIDYLNTYDFSLFDLIVITRGGGSMEDLWGFNNKELIETIYNRKTPVLSAIGHMIDTTLIDFVSDVSAPTPSLAAQYIIDHNMEYINTIESIKKKFYNNMVSDINKNLSILNRLSSLKNEFNEKLKTRHENIKNSLLYDIKTSVKTNLMKLEMYKNKYANNDNIILYKNNNSIKLTFEEFQKTIESNQPFILQWNNKLVEINSYKYI